MDKKCSRQKRTRSARACLIPAVFLVLLFFFSSAAKADTPAADITGSCTITAGGAAVPWTVRDGREDTWQWYAAGTQIRVEAAQPIGGLYIVFDRIPGDWTLQSAGRERSCGQYGFLHEYQKAEEADVRELILSFPASVTIADLYVLSAGDTLPDFVQTWRPAEGPADVLLLACHSDDDQLFFAGAVPDAVARGAEIQVCYFTNHWTRHDRPHEQLNGLWACGLTRYPVIGEFTDTKRVDTEEESLKIFEELGYRFDDMVKAQVSLLRRFQPQIVLVHDINGEYGHGAHRLSSHAMRDAVLAASDASRYPESAQCFGTWDVPKTYVHLYWDQKIWFSIDTPLSYFDRKTAYQVSQQAFLCHISQQGTRYRDWLIGTEENPVTSSAGFPAYSPCDYGLWRSLVGEDVRKTDFYENITLYKDQAPLIPASSEEETEETTTEPPETEATAATEETPEAGDSTDAEMLTTAPPETETPTEETAALTQAETEDVPISSGKEESLTIPAPLIPAADPETEETTQSQEGNTAPAKAKTLLRTAGILCALATVSALFYGILKKRKSRRQRQK
ncbi:MAG: PIG-L family deacetylase [Lachnospiraceae bacterium]|nr:PIG-L family deacetylase [Lachnospiraceae bacterium]